jgi:hypothetical protein
MSEAAEAEDMGSPVRISVDQNTASSEMVQVTVAPSPEEERQETVADAPRADESVAEVAAADVVKQPTGPPKVYSLFRYLDALPLSISLQPRVKVVLSLIYMSRVDI